METSLGSALTRQDLSAELLVCSLRSFQPCRDWSLVTNAYNPNVAMQLRESQDAISKLGLQSEVVEAHTPEGFEAGFATLKARHVDGVVLLGDPW